MTNRLVKRRAHVHRPLLATVRVGVVVEVRRAFAVFDGAELPTAGERQHVNHLALPVDTLEEFGAAYQRLKDHGVAVTDIIERGYGKTFYFHDPNGIRLQIELKTKEDVDSLEGDPNPVPYVRALLQRA
jgi:catechol 2,3-dioxygenase-like lactoylglutathione lyase family enzyme